MRVSPVRWSAIWAIHAISHTPFVATSGLAQSGVERAGRELTRRLDYSTHALLTQFVRGGLHFSGPALPLPSLRHVPRRNQAWEDSHTYGTWSLCEKCAFQGDRDAQRACVVPARGSTLCPRHCHGPPHRVGRPPRLLVCGDSSDTDERSDIHGRI